MKAILQSVSAFALALLMLVFGAFYAVGAVTWLRQWSAIPSALAACALLFELCGAVMIGCGVWVLLTLAHDHRPLRIGGFATAGCGIVLVGGVLAHVIPCSGPT